MAGPLEGIRIIDWTIWQQGPVAAAMLGDLGAEVIHVEHPVQGDPGRGAMRISGVITSIPGGRNFYFETNNRNKKSMTLNLAHEKGRAVMHKLVARSDVFVENMRMGVPERLGMDYESLRPHNPKLIYARGSGYGPRGPDSALPSLDISSQARSGFMFSAGKPGAPPQPVGGGVADQMGAIMLAYGVLAAIIARERLGVGQQVDTSHLGSMVFLQSIAVSSNLFLGRDLPRLDRDRPGNPLWNWYECQDGEWISLGAMFASSWEPFCRATGLAHLIDDPRFDDLEKRKGNAELRQIIDEVFATKPRAEWRRILRAADIIHDPVNRVGDLVSDEQVMANGYIRHFDHPVSGTTKMVGLPVELSETPGELRLPAPEFGQHTEEVLVDICGFSWEEVGTLRDEGVI